MTKVMKGQLNGAIKRFALAAVTAGLMLAPAAWAGLFDDEEARRAILDLRQKVTVLEQGVQQDQKTLQDMPQLREQVTQLKRSLLDLQTLLEQLRADLAKQQGQHEQLAKDVSDMQKRQRDLAQGLDERIRRFEPTKVHVDGLDFSAEPAEVKEYEAALSALRASDFKTAHQAFSDFLRRYPQSGYRGISLFWLAQAQYAKREYKEAIASFNASIEAAPASSKVPEGMLAIANSQIELKDLRAARKTLEDLTRLYPQSEVATAAKDRLARLKKL